MKKKAFTIVELLAVVIILGLLLLVAVPTYNSIIAKSKESSLDSHKKQIEDASRLFVQDCIKYNKCKTDYYLTTYLSGKKLTLDDLINNGYIEPVLSPYDKKPCSADIYIQSDGKDGYKYDIELYCRKNNTENDNDPDTNDKMPTLLIVGNNTDVGYTDENGVTFFRTAPSDFKLTAKNFSPIDYTIKYSDDEQKDFDQWENAISCKYSNNISECPLSDPMYSNNSYTFKIFDNTTKEGVSKSVTMGKYIIDSEGPVISHDSLKDVEIKNSYTIKYKFSISDGELGSGVNKDTITITKNLLGSEIPFTGNIENTDDGIVITVKSNGTYNISVEDNVGNESTYQFDVNLIQGVNPIVSLYNDDNNSINSNIYYASVTPIIKISNNDDIGFSDEDSIIKWCYFNKKELEDNLSSQKIELSKYLDNNCNLTFKLENPLNENNKNVYIYKTNKIIKEEGDNKEYVLYVKKFKNITDAISTNNNGDLESVLGNYLSFEFKIDSSKPEVSVEYDKNNYYSGGVELQIKNTNNRVKSGLSFYSIGEKINGKCNYTQYNWPIDNKGKHTIKENGDYCLKLESKTGMVSEEKVISINNIDSLQPEITVNINNNNYEKKKTASISIKKKGISGISKYYMINLDTNKEVKQTNNSFTIDKNGEYIFYVISGSSISSNQIKITVNSIDNNSPNCGSFVITGTKKNNDYYISDVSIGLKDVSDKESSYDKLKIELSHNKITEDGTKVVELKVTDEAGNTCSNSIEIKIDKTPPTCTNSGDNNSWTRNNVTISYGCSDTGSGCTDSSFGKKEFIESAETGYIGSYDIYDKAGNWTPCDARTANLYIDKSQPTVSIKATKNGESTEVSSGSYSNKVLNFMFTKENLGISEAKIYYCKDTNNSCTPNTEINSGTQLSIDTTGTYFIRYKIENEAGYDSSEAGYDSSDSYKAIVDTTKPYIPYLKNYTYSVDSGASGINIDSICRTTKNSSSVSCNILYEDWNEWYTVFAANPKPAHLSITMDANDNDNGTGIKKIQYSTNGSTYYDYNVTSFNSTLKNQVDNVGLGKSFTFYFKAIDNVRNTSNVLTIIFTRKVNAD